MTTRLFAAMFFVLMLAAGSVQAGGDAAKGAEIANSDCAMCHGDDGMGDDETPALAGMDEATHIADLKGFASGEKEDDSGMMADVASELSEEDMANVAAYYKSLGK